MTIDRAIEILNPAHREHYDGLDEVNEACRMGMEALERARAIPLDAVPPVGRCRDCQKWHRDEGWCDVHSHFIGRNGEACHPWESSDWKMFDENYFCADFVPKEDKSGN